MNSKKIKIIPADTFLKRFKGLMMKNNFDTAMLFSNIADSSVHTCFMRFDIDVYFLDDEKKVIEKVTLKPWKFYKSKNKVEFILETKKDFLDLKIGDVLEFI